MKLPLRGGGGGRLGKEDALVDHMVDLQSHHQRSITAILFSFNLASCCVQEKHLSVWITYQVYIAMCSTQQDSSYNYISLVVGLGLKWKSYIKFLIWQLCSKTSKLVHAC